MFRRRIPLLAVAAAIVACSSPAPPPRAPAPAAPGAAGPAADDWAHVMKQVKLRYERIEDGLTEPAGDLRRVAAAAGEAAELMRLGYGRFEDPTVPGFARMARDTESWFLQLALEARQAHGDIARELFLGERKRHCGDCHDAHERVHG
ncbi:MAG: hypothetical protein JNM25_05140 [Planctomycetes bacterium]|nr:hypothetical protein [Planctomycetota bacterium]